ncbi:uncharacterized protein LOC124866356 [Girardinichthys multiradiatus]|uniref:uncharacterized protein LOC124866356 n=1 Tax=Girardinichthys multiradiatus TaxID=208333 RepID=UPI001FABEACA|nr:uncharacterized protein LOC124866356 [Girardinichthys multiradiatus]
MLCRGLGINVIPRRVYSVPAPNSLWHIDGNHKLIRWRIVIHGGIDGYSRKIMYLCANNNNRASTVLSAFLAAVQQFGIPTRVRNDKGGENVHVARFMLEHPQRGPDRTSFITGWSVHNQIIERLWRDVWCSVTVNYYTAFQHLYNSGVLNVDDELDLICLHYVMLPKINEHLQLFKKAWDRHRLSTEHGKSPQQLWIEGQIMGAHPITEPVCEQGTLEDYGIDWEGPTPVDHEAAVDVPENPMPLQNRVFEHLRERIDPLRPSTCFGMDILVEALESARRIFHDVRDRVGQA